MRRFVPILVVVSLVLVGGAGWLGARSAGQNNAPVKAKPATVPVGRGDVQQTVTAPGLLVAARSASLGATTAGRVTEVNVREGQRVDEGQLLLQLDEAGAALQLKNAQANLRIARARLAQARSPSTAGDIANARAKLAAAQASYDKLAAGPSAADLAASRAAVASARSAHDAALKAAGASTSQLEAASAALARAEAQLQRAQGAYDRVASAPDIGARPESMALQSATIDYQQAKANYDALQATVGSDAQSRVQSTMAQLQQAQAALDRLQGGATQAELASAEAQLVQAQGDLDKLLAGPEANSLEIAEAGVQQAELAVAEAQMKLDDSRVVAPFAGIVLEVSVQPGDGVSPGATLVKLSDPSTMEVRSTVVEEDLALVRPGQPAELFFDAVPDASLRGRIDRIVPQRETSDNRAVYPVILSLDAPPPDLLPGMTVDASIVVDGRQNVLRLPRALVRASANGLATVQVWDGQAAVSRQIKTGLRGDVYVEILEGLSGGEEVVGQ